MSCIRCQSLGCRDRVGFADKVSYLLKRMNLWDDIQSAKASSEGVSDAIFRKLGHNDRTSTPNSWWLTLSNEYMLNTIRGCNHSEDRLW